MEKVKIRIVSKSGVLPQYETEGSAGMDLRACLEAPVSIAPGKRKLIPTGIFIELPAGYEAQIRGRSGLALRAGIGLVNAPGTIDSDYRGEIKVILINWGDKPFVVNDGDRIAQMIISRYANAEWVKSDTLSESERSAGGFGHTGR